MRDMTNDYNYVEVKAYCVYTEGKGYCIGKPNTYDEDINLAMTSYVLENLEEFCVKAVELGIIDSDYEIRSFGKYVMEEK